MNVTHSAHKFYRVPVFAVSLLMLLFTGCASGGGGGSSFTGNTSVTFLATSTANDRLSGFAMNMTSLSLTNKAGQTVSVFSSPEGAEFIHLNGTSEPLVTVSIPEGIYTAATGVVGGAAFACNTFNSSGGIDSSVYSYGATPANQTTVTLASPITITGDAMTLSLNLLVSKSATFDSNCSSDTGTNPYSINPTFSLSSTDITQISGLSGITSSTPSSNTFTVKASDGNVWSVTVNTATMLQGVASSTAITNSMPINFDASLQPDGSLLATRLSVTSTNTTDLSLDTGPILNVDALVPVSYFGIELSQGYFTSQNTNDLYFGNYASFGSATFNISNQLPNLQTLPFPASFTATNMVAGQRVALTFNAATESPEPIYLPTSTLTLVPQTINGTITAVSTQGNFSTYTISLAPYDLIPLLAVQQGQTTLLNNPSTVVVYADSSAQQLHTTALAVGNVMRFHGLLFNDNGTLRMDCDQINDGVAE